ncbi:unnamed protein product [Arctogadus glacialis]
MMCGLIQTRTSTHKDCALIAVHGAQAMAASGSTLIELVNNSELQRGVEEQKGWAAARRERRGGGVETDSTDNRIVALRLHQVDRQGMGYRRVYGVLRVAPTSSGNHPGIELASFWLPVNPLYHLSYCHPLRVPRLTLDCGRAVGEMTAKVLV